MTIAADFFSHLEELIRWGMVDAIRQQDFLLLLHAQPNLAYECDKHCVSLLMLAADAGNKEAIKALCNLGADVNAISCGSETPLINAVRRESAGDVDRKLTLEIVQILLGYGADPNLIGFQGCSALHWSVIEGDASIVEILLRYKGDVGLCTADRIPMSIMDILGSGRFRGTVAQREGVAKVIKCCECSAT